MNEQNTGDRTPREAGTWKLDDLLWHQTDSFVLVIPGPGTVRVAWGDPRIKATQYNRGIVVLDPETRELYKISPEPHKTFELVGTTSFFWDNDKFLGTSEYEIGSVRELKQKFRYLGFVVP